jgi:PKD repeat protein
MGVPRLYVYTEGGVYNCTLTAYNTVDSLQDTEIKKRFITVGTAKAEFMIDLDTVCTGQEVTFTPSMVGRITLWEWNFGDGSSIVTDSNPNPVTHVYDTAGTFTVKLTIIDTCGTRTDSDFVVIKACPIVKFFADTTEGCAPFEVTFFDSSEVDSDQAIQSRLWDFGNGQTSTDQNPIITYDTGGVYTVILTVTDSQGASSTDSMVDYITVYDAPIAQFKAITDTQACVSQYQQFQVKFVNESLGKVDSLTWDFGDSTFSTDSSPVHAYIVPGFYNVKLTVKGTCGIDSLIKDSFVVLTDTLDSDGVGFIIAPDSGDTSVTFTFTDTSKGLILSRHWLVDTIVVNNAVEVKQKFSDTGWYQISLTDRNQCNSVTKIDSVHVIP